MRLNKWITKSVAVDSNTYALDAGDVNGFLSITGDQAGRKITSITGGEAGQWLILLFDDSNVSVGTAAGKLLGNADYVGDQYDILFLGCNGTEWREISRQQQAGFLPALLRAAKANNSTLKLEAYDVDGTAYTTMLTVTSANTPLMTANQDLTIATGKAIKTSTSNGNTLLIQAYDVDGAAYTTMLTFTAGNTPAMTANQDLTIADGKNIILDTTTGTKIGTATSQKLGFFNATPVVRPTALTAADASTVDGTYGAEEAAVIANLRTRLGELETKLQALGLLA